ncbi:MAG: hypothetical protein D4R63_11560 [Methylococcaceae bacterium]|jgi:uncharacterized membrane protein (Fun14 family)|nr:MAG: hypothetical protein D4R63_11560 [Methylococcaceae bacterium]
MNTTVINDTSFADFLSSEFLMGNIGAPFAIGLAVGYFVKKMLKTFLFVAGAVCVALFVSEHFGVVSITDTELQSAAQSATATVKTSGDFLVNRLSSITSKGVSGVAGFFFGFKVG